MLTSILTCCSEFPDGWGEVGAESCWWLPGSPLPPPVFVPHLEHTATEGHARTHPHPQQLGAEMATPCISLVTGQPLVLKEVTPSMLAKKRNSHRRATGTPQLQQQAQQLRDGEESGEAGVKQQTNEETDEKEEEESILNPAVPQKM